MSFSVANFLVAVCSISVLFGQANLVMNGDFATGDFTDWTMTGPGLAVENGTSPPVGQYAARFSSTQTTPGTISQTIATVPGISCTFSFDLKNTGHSGDAITNEFSASFGSDQVLTLSDAAAFPYTPYTFSVTPTASSTVVEFSGRNHCCYYYLAGVSVVQPLPTPPAPSGPTSLPVPFGLRGQSLIVLNYLNSVVSFLGNAYSPLSNLTGSSYTNALKVINPDRNSIATFASQNAAFVLSDALSVRLGNQRMFHLFQSPPQDSHAFSGPVNVNENELMAANAYPERIRPANKPYGIWLTGFGNFSHQGSLGQNPSFNANTGGTLLGFDYGNFKNGIVGVAGGYAHTHLHQYNDLGKGSIESGYAALYGTAFVEKFYLEAAVWGNINQVENKRHIFFPGFDATATSKTHSYQCTPHFALGYDVTFKSGILEPFVSLDWVISHQKGYKESGAGSLDMDIQSIHSWMFRTEAGLNGYWQYQFCWGFFISRGKLSYINKDPHHTGRVSASLVGAPGSFTVETFTKKQNLISPAVEFVLKSNLGIFGSLLYNGEFGSGYTSNMANLEIGYYF